MEKKKLKEHTTRRYIDSVQNAKIACPRVLGVYTMHEGKNLIVREKVL